MFREFKHVRQEPGGQRRWFEAPEIEFVVWLDQVGGQTGFQLIYQLSGKECALTWRRGLGFNHSRVDSGDILFSKQTPLLIADGAVPWGGIEDLCQKHASSLEVEFRELVLGRLAERR